MDFRFISLFILICCINNIQAIDPTQCFPEGMTWSSDGLLDVVANVASPGKCLELCQSIDIDCKGYTWYGEEPSSGFRDICVLFQALDKEGGCISDCTSGNATAIADGLCACDEEKDRGCVIEESNFVGGLQTVTAFDCEIACGKGQQGACRYYTWYPGHDGIEQFCFLFSECLTLIDCPGCYKGSIDCPTPKE